MYEFLFKVVLAFKGEPFGRAWLGVFWPQGGALWLGNSWLDLSSRGSPLLRSSEFGDWFFLDLLVFSSRQRPKIHLYRNSFSHGIKIYYHDGAVIKEKLLLMLVVLSRRRTRIHMSGSSFSHRTSFSFQDGGVIKESLFLKYIYCTFGLQRGTNLVRVHFGGRGLGTFLRRLWSFWRRHYTSLEVLRHSCICDDVRVKELQECRLVLHQDEVGGLVHLDHIHMVTVDTIAIDEVGLLEVLQHKFEVSVLTSLESPHVHLCLVHTMLQSWRQEVEVRPTCMHIQKPVRKQRVLSESYYYAEVTYLATRGDFLSVVWRTTDSRRLGGMWMPRWRLTRDTRMTSSFSPCLRRGMAGPLNTRDLRIWNFNVLKCNFGFLTRQLWRGLWPKTLRCFLHDGERQSWRGQTGCSGDPSDLWTSCLTGPGG